MTDEHQRQRRQSRHQIGDIIFIVSKSEDAEEHLMKELKSHAFIILNIVDARYPLGADYLVARWRLAGLGEPPYYEARSIQNNLPITIGSINDPDYIVL